MLGPIGIGHELDDAPGNVDGTPDGAAAQLVRFAHVEQHHVTFIQLRSELGGSQVLDDGACQSDLHVDVPDPRIISHATIVTVGAFPGRSPVAFVRPGTGNVLGTRQRAPSPTQRRSLRRPHKGATMTITEQSDVGTEPASLFDRIGGRAGLEKIVPDVVQLHMENPIVGERFRNAKKPPAELARLAIEFFATGLSGNPTYDGMSMPAAHAGMGINEAEYIAVLDDILAALQKHGIGQQEQAELLYIAYSMKSEILAK